MCVCVDGEVCDGLCVDTQTSTGHCGACFTRCEGGTCRNGTCECNDEADTLCNGSCVDLSASLLDCGSCGAPCLTGGTVCENGECVCYMSGAVPCDDVCIDVTADSANCGACGVSCESGSGCMDGECVDAAPIDPNDPPPERNPLGVSYAETLAELFDSRCTSTCHEPGGILGGPGGIDTVQQDLTRDAGYATLTRNRSTQLPTMWLVGETPEQSYLWYKLNDRQIEVGGSGIRMPFVGEPLNTEELALVRAWIEDGAAP